MLLDSGCLDQLARSVVGSTGPGGGGPGGAGGVGAAAMAAAQRRLLEQRMLSYVRLLIAMAVSSDPSLPAALYSNSSYAATGAGYAPAGRGGIGGIGALGGQPPRLSIEVVKGSLSFLRVNHSAVRHFLQVQADPNHIGGLALPLTLTPTRTVRHFLQVQADSIGGLYVTEALLALLVICAHAFVSPGPLLVSAGGGGLSSAGGSTAATPSNYKRMKREADAAIGGPGASEPLLDMALGTYSDVFTADVCKLLTLVGELVTASRSEESK